MQIQSTATPAATITIEDNHNPASYGNAYANTNTLQTHCRLFADFATLNNGNSTADFFCSLQLYTIQERPCVLVVTVGTVRIL